MQAETFLSLSIRSKREKAGRSIGVRTSTHATTFGRRRVGEESFFESRLSWKKKTFFFVSLKEATISQWAENVSQVELNCRFLNTQQPKMDEDDRPNVETGDVICSDNGDFAYRIGDLIGQGRRVYPNFLLSVSHDASST